MTSSKKLLLLQTTACQWRFIVLIAFATVVPLLSLLSVLDVLDKPIIAKIAREIDFIDAKEDDAVGPPQLKPQLSFLGKFIEKPQQLNTTTPQLVSESVLHFGNQHRLHRKLLQLAMNLNEPKQASDSSKVLRMAAVGGSNTLAKYMGRRPIYYEYLTNWLNATLEPLGIKVTMVNTAVSGTGSEYYSHCVEEFLDLNELDVLIVELAVNDALPASYMPGYKEKGRPLEEFVRTVWRRNPNLHLVLVNFVHVPTLLLVKDDPDANNDADSNDGKRNMTCNWIDDREFLEVARFYDIPSIRWKHVMCANWTDDARVSNAIWQAIFDKFVAEDHNHPSEFVHRQIGEFMIAHFRSSVELMKRLLPDRYRDDEVTPQFLAEIDATAIKVATDRILSRPALFASTWVDQSDCFVSLGWESNRRTIRSKESLKQSSGVDIYYEYMRSSSSYLVYFGIDTKTTSYVDFDLQPIKIAKPSCPPCAGYLPHVAIAYTLCADCHKAGLINTSVSFRFDDGSTFEHAFNTSLSLSYYYVTYVHYLTTTESFLAAAAKSSGDGNGGVKFCRPDQPALTSVNVHLQQLNNNYFIALHSIIVAYDCCNLDQLDSGKVPLSS